MRARRCVISAMVFALGCSSGSSGSGSGGSGGATTTGGAGGAGTTVGSGGTSATGGTAGAGTSRGGSAGGGAPGAGGVRAAGGDAGVATGGTSGGVGGAGTGGASGHAGGASGHAGGASGNAGTAGAGGALAGWTLTWSDEFDGADGSAVDPTKWIHDIGGSGWGNQELEYYTDGTQNAVVTGGNLVITAAANTNSTYTCSYPNSGNVCKYTSARLLTKGKFSQKYGRFEARIQIPEGQGIWPAFWMLGANIDTPGDGWPVCGEIDVMENIGKEPSINHGSLHMPAAGTTADSSLTGMYTLAAGAKLGDAFHVYAIEWSASAINFYVDGTLYETQTPQTATGRTWEFDQPFFILLNVAVGGQWPGAPDATSTFPQTMKVDYVRVYTAAP